MSMLPKLWFYIAMAAIAITLQLALGEPLSAMLLPGDRHDQRFEWDCILGLVLGLATVIFSQRSAERFAWSHRLNTEFKTALGPLSHGEILCLAALSGFSEELLFRGVLQSQLGLEVTALLFGLAHLRLKRHLWPWTLAAVIMGYLFGALVEFRGCLVSAIVAHFLINYFNLHFICRHVGPRAALVVKKNSSTETISRHL